MTEFTFICYQKYTGIYFYSWLQPAGILPLASIHTGLELTMRNLTGLWNTLHILMPRKEQQL